jgi:uncharacterized protein (DUF362 family)
MTVRIVHCPDYDVKVMEDRIAGALDDLDLDPRGKTAVLKPNIVIAAKPGSAMITHPAVAEAVINALRRGGIGDITIAEGPGLGADEERFFELSGYRELAGRKKVSLVNLNRAERTRVQWRYGTIGIPKIVLEAGLYINLPKMKTHGQTMVTLSLKNQKGLLSHAAKKRFHQLGLHEPLVELAKVVSPHLVVVDGIVGMEGEGPLNGKRKRAGALVIGTNQLEADIVCCGIMGIDYRKVDHLTFGIREKIGPEVPKVIGSLDSAGVRTPFLEANQRYGKLLNIYSWRDPHACSMCIDSFSLAVKYAIRNPKYWFTFLPRFAYYALFRQLNIIQGKQTQIPDVKGEVICLGDCTKELAEKEGLRHIPGCPPDRDTILQAFSRTRWGSKRDR